MIADYNTMLRMFRECNKMYFNKSLPTPKFVLMNKPNTLARFEFNRNKKGKHSIKWQKIIFSDCYDFPEDVFRNLMVHELLHYFIAWNGIRDKKDHRKEFMKIDNELNETVKYDSTSFPRTEKASQHKGLMKFLFG